MIPLIYFHRISRSEGVDAVSKSAQELLSKVITENKIVFNKKLPIKVHFGEPGNISFIKPDNFLGMISYIKEQGVDPFYIETNTAGGPRSTSASHLVIAGNHGFTQLPCIIADGEKGNDHVSIPIKKGKHFTSCLIGRELASQSQILVISHFKGHIMSGFGGAIKQLGIGFASGKGKIIAHSKVEVPDGKSINWSDQTSLYTGTEFRERSAEYALAAVNGKQYIYITFALSLVKNCDCDGEPMTPVYEDLGIFAGTDPVALDKACFDMLQKREGKKPFEGDDIFSYAESIGLGSTTYTLKEC